MYAGGPLGPGFGTPALDVNGLIAANQVPPTSAITGATAPAVTNVMAPYTAGLYALYSCMPLLSSYTGALCTVRRETDGATLDITGTAASYNSAAILLWAAGSDVYVTAVYDQSGNGRSIPIATAQQPRLNLGGAYPTLEFDGAGAGAGAYLTATSALGGWLQNATGASIVALRKNDGSSLVSSRPLVFASIGTSTSTRLSMGLDSTLGTSAVQGRRLDADALNRSGGFAPDVSWDVEIGRWDFTNAQVYHATSVAAEARSYQAAGAVSNTASQVVAIGAIPGNGSAFFQGKLAAIAFYSTPLTNAQTIAINAALNALIPAVANPSFTLDWLGAGLTGTYTLAPGLTNYTVLAPDGSTPAAGNLAGDRYHHHTKIAVMSNGRIWVAFSTAAASEEQGGQFAGLASTPAVSTAFSAPLTAVPSQSLPYQLTGTGDVIGTVVGYPRTFVTVGGNLYLVTAFDKVNTVGSALSYQQGVALIAVQCNTDGTLGTPFLVGPMPYTPASGVTAYSYDTTLSPKVYAAAANFGTWGGSAPGQPPSLWFGTISQNGNYYNEPTTLTLNTAGTALLRLYRKNPGNMQAWLYVSKSVDGGRTWSAIARTNVPSAITETTGIALADGRIVVIGNPQFLSGSAQRDPLYIAVFSPSTGQLCGGAPYALRQGLSNTPTYANGQSGGAQYPGVASDGTTLYVSYSITKQTVAMTTVPIANLPACS